MIFMTRSSLSLVRVLYFGICDPNFSRNKIYVDGLRANGIEVIVCMDKSSGFRKFWNLFWKHWRLRSDYDVMIVGYTSYIAVPFARIITRKPVIFDALCSYYESEIISRDAFKGRPFRITYVRFVDWISTRCAHKILVETEKQKEYFINTLGVKSDKCVVVYTGVDSSIFYFDSSIKKAEQFTVLFRGRINRESGAKHVLRAAKMLENEDVRFLIIGYGWDEAMREFSAILAESSLKNVTHIGKQIPIEELRTLMLSSHISLGQLEDNERLKRTIPHKAFESIAMKLPYITARADGISEIVKDGEQCIMVIPADPKDLADKILKLKNDKVLRDKIVDSAYFLYEQKFTPQKIVQPIIGILRTLHY